MSIGKLAGTSIFTAIAASLCCITPVLALIAGSGSIAASFSWIEPARPYLIGITIAVLAFAWYQKLRPQAVDECGCAVDQKPKFFQSKAFLLLVTLFSALMITFPVYAKIFFPKSEKTSVVVEKSNLQRVELGIKGMTCAACEEHVNHAVNKLPGIIKITTSYQNKNSIINFDSAKTNLQKIVEAVNSTGYTVISQSLKN
jgi:copper chaperone CopZ